MAEVAREPAPEALAVAAHAFGGVGRTAVSARRIHGPPDVAEHPVGHESAARDGIEVQRFLIDLDLAFEPDLGDRNEWLVRGARALSLDANGCMTRDSGGERLFTRRAV